MAIRGKIAAVKTLIVYAEGETEYAYLNHLKSLTPKPLKLEPMLPKASASNPISLISKAMKEKDDFLEVVCIIDCDVFANDKTLKQKYEHIKVKARKKNIIIIESKPCFEYFLLLHFEYSVPAVDKCDKFVKKVESHYAKNSCAYSKGLRAFKGKASELFNAESLKVAHKNSLKSCDSKEDGCCYSEMHKLLDLLGLAS